MAGIMAGFVFVIRHHIVMIVMHYNFIAVAIVNVVMMVVVNHIGIPIVIRPAYVILGLTPIVGLRLRTKGNQRACGQN